MAGLADLFGGGGMFGGGSLYGDMLTPEQKQALAFRGLMAAAGAFGQAAMPSRMPVPIGAALGQAGAAMAQGQDEGATAALRAALVGQQGAALKQKSEFQKAFMEDNGKLSAAIAAIMGGGTPSTAGPVAAVPGAAPASAGMMERVVPAGPEMSVGGAIPAQAAQAAGLPPWVNDPNDRGLRNIPGLDQTAQQQAMEQFKAALFAQPGASPSVTAAGMATPAQAASLAGGLDAVLSGGGAAPPVRMAQAGAPLAGAAAPTQAPPTFGSLAPGGGVDQAKMQALLLALAGKNAGAEVLGMGNPYNSYLSVLQGSPQYKGATAYAEKAAVLPLVAPTAAAQKSGEHPYDIALERERAANALRNQLAGLGLAGGPAGVAEIPNYGQSVAGIKGAEAEAQQNAILRREQAMARFNVDPNAIVAPPANLGGGLRAGGAIPGGAAAQAAPPVPQGPASGPGFTEPLPTSYGTVIPPVAEAAPIVGSPDYLKTRQTGKGGWTETEGQWSEARAPMKKAEKAALTVAEVLRTYESGSFAGQLSDIRAKLRAVGIDLPEAIAGDPAKAQKIIKENFSQTISSLKGFDSNPAVYQIKLAFENWANTNLQPEANLAIIASSIGLARWQEKLQQDFAEAKKYGWRDPQDFMLKWDQQPQNSLSAFTAAAQKEVGHLKGAPGGPPTGTPKRSYYDPQTGTLRPME